MVVFVKEAFFIDAAYDLGVFVGSLLGTVTFVFMRQIMFFLLLEGVAVLNTQLFTIFEWVSLYDLKVIITLFVKIRSILVFR